jgi:hypothetical protein
VPVSKADFAFAYVSLIYLATRASGKSAAVGSLKIAKLNESHRSIGVAFEVLDLGN